MKSLRPFLRPGLRAALVFSLAASEARAAEDAAGFYLLGAKGSLAGIVPPPGTYLSDLKYTYTGGAAGHAAAGAVQRRLGPIVAEADLSVRGAVYFEIPSVLWVAPEKVAGASLGLGVLAPVGLKDVNADLYTRTQLFLPAAGVTLERGRDFGFGDSTGNFGDPVASAVLGWEQGNWHGNIGALVNIPIGQWERDNIASIGFHRWGLDVTGALTWYDARSGHEISGAAGFTFNGENPATDYKTGTEFHLEFALMQHLSKAFALGLVGYHYEQVTGDSGAGARLGSFKGRVTAVGPAFTYNLILENLALSASLSWAHEFEARNRLDGDAVLFTLSLPLAAGKP